MLKTWEETKSFDEIILSEEKKIVDDVRRETTIRCPSLKLEGDYFYYCGHNLAEEITDKSISPASPIYQRKVECAVLQLHCLSDYKSCCVYKGLLKK